ncbi:MAG: four helix bundle protein, partial [Nitrospirota bacterium]
MTITNNQTAITKQTFDLEERTLDFAKRIIRLCKKLPRNNINQEVVSQLIRSSGSIGA